METDTQGGIVMSSLSLTLYHIYALIIKELLAFRKDPKSRVILIVPRPRTGIALRLYGHV